MYVIVWLRNMLATAYNGKLSIWLTNLIKTANTVDVDEEKYDQKMFKVQNALTLLASQEALRLPILETRDFYSDRQTSVVFH